MYDAGAELFMRHRLGQNGLDEGVCVLVRGIADFFDNAPFEPAAMLQLAREDAGKLEGNPVLVMLSIWLTYGLVNCLCLVELSFSTGGAREVDYAVF